MLFTNYFTSDNNQLSRQPLNNSNCVIWPLLESKSSTKQKQYTIPPLRPNTNNEIRRCNSGTNRGMPSNQSIKRKHKKPIKRKNFITISPPKRETRVHGPKDKQQKHNYAYRTAPYLSTGFRRRVDLRNGALCSVSFATVCDWPSSSDVILSLGQVFATFATFFTASDSFLNTQNICSSMFWAVSRKFILQLFATFTIFMCNFLLQILLSIAQNVKV